MAMRAIAVLCLGVLMMAGPAESAPTESPGHITGIGGVFFKAKDPKALAAWYRDVLGMPVEAWGGAALHYDAQKHPPAAAWSAFPASTNYFAPSTGDFMINYTVAILKRTDDDPSGRFAWILDPEGNKIELWEPKTTAKP